MSQERVRRGGLAWYLEAPLLVIGYVAFGFARAAVYRGDGPATSVAVFVQRLEQTLRIAVEYPLNHAMLGHPVVIHVVGYFYRICVVAVPVVLIWLYVTRSARYRRLLLVLVVTMLLDVVLVWLFPESPPRMAQSGIVDHMATYDILGGAASRTPNRAVNPLAAMPSMHIAWTTWCAYAVSSSVRSRRGWLAWLFPLLTAVVVLVTGHHYVLDIVAGVALVALSIGLVQVAYKRRCTEF
ncbi:phosphatase PAP2 family protein [Amycolatopsis sp. NBC_00438]|uniref:phosphatase PAP2 family protein n=1 Tax=Amycolatopsis sp. NBC_00438 TaxID=2903558 RepID=UPI002E233C39